jgi:DNA mismatch repair ATPase MutL
MINLIQEWFENIDGMFVCQHGRPSFVKIDKKKIDELFDR